MSDMSKQASEIRIQNMKTAMSTYTTCTNFAAAAFTVIILICCCECTNAWQNEMILDRKGDFQMFWNLSAENMTIEVQVRTKGYVGFGFSPFGGMKSADIVIAWVTNSQVILQDRFSSDYVEPTIDDDQDYELISGFENDTHTIVRFTRMLETCDKLDLPIVNTTMNIIYAWGTDDPLSEDKIEYHGGVNRGSKSINLIAPNVHLLSKPDDMHTWDIPFPKVTVSPKETTNVCHVTKIPPTNKTLHIVSMQLLQPENDIQLHHVVICQCFDQYTSVFEKELNAEDPYCISQLFCPNYVIGISVSDQFEISTTFGIQLGRPDIPTYYNFQIHYNNPTFRKGSADQAALQVITTEKLMEHDVGTVTIAGIVDIIIPPKQPNFTYSTIYPAECTAKDLPVDGINIVSVAFHAHITATKIHLRHFRDGVELPLIKYTNNYDFRLQRGTNLLKEVKVMPGDVLTVQCEFNTMDRTNFTMGGPATHDEMCIVGLTYYPKSELFTILKTGPYQGLLQILKSASSKQTNSKSSHISSKMLPYGFVRNFNASILTKQDIYELSYIQTYGKMEGLCVTSANTITHFTVDYPNIKPISYEETSCEQSSMTS